MDVHGISRTDSTVETVSVLRVSGEVDLATASDLRRQLSLATADPSVVLVVDLSGVTFLSCSGLLPLLEAHARLGDRLRLRNLSRSVRRLLDLTGLRTRFGVLDGIADSEQLGGKRSASMSAPSSRAGRSEPTIPAFVASATTAVTRSWEDGSDVVQTTAAFDLQAQATGLQEQMRRSVLIEQAKGLLMGIHRCDASTTWRLLTAASQEYDVSVDDLARALITAASGRTDRASGHIALAAVRALMSPARAGG